MKKPKKKPCTNTFIRKTEKLCMNRYYQNLIFLLFSHSAISAAIFSSEFQRLCHYVMNSSVTVHFTACVARFGNILAYCMHRTHAVKFLKYPDARTFALNIAFNTSAVIQANSATLVSVTVHISQILGALNSLTVVSKHSSHFISVFPPGKGDVSAVSRIRMHV